MNLHIYIDADACPVREETYTVARRHNIPVTVVSNSYIRTPKDMTFKLVDDSFDAADDYIAETVKPNDIVITSDILLAERVLKSNARVLAPTGKPMTTDTIGSQIAVRAIMADLRAGAEQPNIGGPAAFTQRDRSRFLEALHLMAERTK
ncbi:YaiI/YqxD family protein [Litorimonas sp. WD9-15]|uniref:YaiI/YqxD family protein n=1 Tax=Litorimonas sp. WD9-15 TaxID=3418716 RepID=UPI003D07CD5F